MLQSADSSTSLSGLPIAIPLDRRRPCCIVIASCIVVFSLLHSISTNFSNLFALIPSRTIYGATVGTLTVPFVWNIVTFNLFETHPLKALITGPAFFLLGRPMEEHWGSREFMRFLAFSGVINGVAVFIYKVFHWYATLSETDFFQPLCSACGLLAALTVGIKQAMPMDEVRAFGQAIPHLKGRTLPFIYLTIGCIGLLLGFVTGVEFVLCSVGIFNGWLFLRHYLYFELTQAYGDHSVDFELATLFPQPLRPAVAFVASLVHQAFQACGLFKTRRDNVPPKSYYLNAPRVTLTPEQATVDRWRNKGKQFLDKYISGGQGLPARYKYPQRTAAMAEEDLERDGSKAAAPPTPLI
uniref:Uncharacterized protein n=1 Tax=Vitrella brassicaformis TaxID=1169539 RepID=A0A7S1JY00_9ALVE|mmetsp:Transcript_28924/g.72088  ORF Transcript_28924/g.72088 Transcript_28924/m.72088 type:complete len:354 (+) Transcript_28924:288-1349(+)